VRRRETRENSGSNPFCSLSQKVRGKSGAGKRPREEAITAEGQEWVLLRIDSERRGKKVTIDYTLRTSLLTTLSYERTVRPCVSR